MQRYKGKQFMAVNITLYFAFQMEHLDAYLAVELLEAQIPLLDILLAVLQMAMQLDPVFCRHIFSLQSHGLLKIHREL